ncbi:MAG: hypothetical protein ACQCN6_00365 [Candidatus Bathyarchaeia archaeon]
MNFLDQIRSIDRIEARPIYRFTDWPPNLFAYLLQETGKNRAEKRMEEFENANSNTFNHLSTPTVSRLWL